MADRGMSAELLAAIAARQVRVATLVEIQLDGASDLYYTDGARPITVLSNTYQPAGRLLNFTEITESGTPAADKVTIYLSGADRSLVPILLNADYIARKVVLSLAFLDEDWQLIDTLQIYWGYIDRPVITDNPDTGECSIGLVVANEYSDWLRRRGRRNTKVECQRYYPDDLGFEFTDYLLRSLYWH